MTASRVEPIKIFVTDFDGCAISISNSIRPDLLSQSLIDIARRNQYTAMYGCTHRAYVSYKATKYFAENILDLLNKNKENPIPFDPNAVFSISIVNNFSGATGLTCLAVSTPDDHCVEGEMVSKCGSGFNNIIKKYEADLILKNNLQDISNGAAYVIHDYDGEHGKIRYQ
jgi:hypothetical protein